MQRHAHADPQSSQAELLRLLERADELVAGASCTCATATDAEGAFCCHFVNIGREPYVTELELTLVARAIATAGGRARSAVAGRGSASQPFAGRGPASEPSAGRGRRRLPMADTLGTCPLLSPTGRCTVYASRPLGCRTFFCEGHGPPKGAANRRAMLELARRVADLSDRVFPRSGGPRPLRRALASLAGRGTR